VQRRVPSCAARCKDARDFSHRETDGERERGREGCISGPVRHVTHISITSTGHKYRTAALLERPTARDSSRKGKIYPRPSKDHPCAEEDTNSSRKFIWRVKRIVWLAREPFIAGRKSKPRAIAREKGAAFHSAKPAAYFRNDPGSPSSRSPLEIGKSE